MGTLARARLARYACKSEICDMGSAVLDVPGYIYRFSLHL